VLNDLQILELSTVTVCTHDFIFERENEAIYSLAKNSRINYSFSDMYEILLQQWELNGSGWNKLRHSKVLLLKPAIS
jgi:hypothetical protein